MKKIFRKLTTLLVAGALTIGMATTAFAADTTITYGGKDQSGNKLFEFLIPGEVAEDQLVTEKEYTTSDLFDGFKNVMPGDTLTQKITVKNDSSKKITVTLSSKDHNETDNPLTYSSETEYKDGKDQSNTTDGADDGKRDESVTSSNDFLKQLGLKVYDADPANPDAKTLYDGKAQNLGSGISLGDITSKSSTDLYVQLSIPINMNNQYANRVGEVDWVFTLSEGGGGHNPGGGDTSMTVTKIWSGDTEADRPDSITVTLTGKWNLSGDKPDITKTETLSENNNWTFSWTQLDDSYKWTVEETDVPDGYTVSYTTSQSGKVTTITNSIPGGGSSEDTPPSDPSGGPSGDTPPGGDDGGNGGGDGPGDPVFTSDLTVVKAWDGDNSANRPDSVTLQLYNGAEEMDTITLTAADNWTYTWDDLAADGQWRVVEIDIPVGYTPVYSNSNGVITITNTVSLLDTGQTNWPIPVLGAFGLMLLAGGLYLTQRKKNHAE